jgi:hypothetical protein
LSAKIRLTVAVAEALDIEDKCVGKDYLCGMNDGISASCENASSATLKVATEIAREMKHFYILKRRNILRRNNLVMVLQHGMKLF